ncbi:restriction endonuclease subunit S [uncultured Pedobacter sp.]|uniref:restriction endonuclease subunit S n=1 Tax=uncultured Pedobacter sp. TaxID=246139 RepID=UPI0025F63C12|nr:restriction endonuclease subunit S [uncultured Pedobacter sp.]
MDENLPDNWVSSSIADVADILDNLRKPVSSVERAKRIGNIPYYGATGLAGYIDNFIFDEELILLGEDGAPFFDKSKNVAFKIEGKSWVNNHAHVLRAKFQTRNDFLLHYLNQFNYAGFVGGTTRLKLTQGDLKKIPFPLPPLAEQERIVAKLAKLFAQIGIMKKALERIPRLLKDFRQQVLMQAVTGKLTDEWRIKNKDTFSMPIDFQDLVVNSSNGISKRYSETGENTIVLRLANFKEGKRIMGDERLIRLNHKEIEKYKLKENDILVIRVNGSITLAGVFILYRQNLKCETYCDHFIRYKVNEEKANPAFITYFANNGEGRKYLQESLSTSAGQNTINQKSIGGLKINLPSLEEQNEIVFLVNLLLLKADLIEEKYKLLKGNIESLPQTILHKAFKGELVEQLPTDGDAKDLLEEIKKLKIKK